MERIKVKFSEYSIRIYIAPVIRFEYNKHFSLRDLQRGYS